MFKANLVFSILGQQRLHRHQVGQLVGQCKTNTAVLSCTSTYIKMLLACQMQWQWALGTQEVRQEA